MTDEEIQAIAAQLGPLVAKVAAAEGFTDPDDVQDWLERLLMSNGYYCRNGVWHAPTH